MVMHVCLAIVTEEQRKDTGFRGNDCSELAGQGLTCAYLGQMVTHDREQD